MAFLPGIAACHSFSAILKPVDGSTWLCCVFINSIVAFGSRLAWIFDFPVVPHSLFAFVGLVFLFARSVATLVAFLFLLFVLTSICHVSWTSRFPSSSMAITTGGISMCRCMYVLYVTMPLSSLWWLLFLGAFWILLYTILHALSPSCGFIRPCPYLSLWMVIMQ